MMKLLTVVGGVLLLFCEVKGGSLRFTEAGSCGLEPTDQIDPQSGESPFVIKLSSKTYNKGESIIEPSSEVGKIGFNPSFHLFIFQTKRWKDELLNDTRTKRVDVSSSDNTVFYNGIFAAECPSCRTPSDLGTFTKLDDDLTIYNCGEKGEAVLPAAYTMRTHFKFLWTPNPSLDEDVRIKGSIADSGSTWWKHLTSETMTPSSKPQIISGSDSSRSQLILYFMMVFLCLKLYKPE